MMEHFVFSAFADEYAVDFSRQLDALNSFGIPYLEIRHVSGKNISTLGKNEIHEVKKALDCHGIKVNSIGSPLGKIPLDDDMDAHMETAKNVFETANILDAKCVRMFSFYPPEGKAIENCRDEVIAALEKMVALAETYGILLCHENEANLYGETPERCLDVLRQHRITNSSKRSKRKEARQRRPQRERQIAIRPPEKVWQQEGGLPRQRAYEVEQRVWLSLAIVFCGNETVL